MRIIPYLDLVQQNSFLKFNLKPLNIANELINGLSLPLL